MHGHSHIVNWSIMAMIGAKGAEVMQIGPKHVNIVCLRDWSVQDTVQCSSTDLFQRIDKINVQVDSHNLTMKETALPCSSNLNYDLSQIPTRTRTAKERLELCYSIADTCHCTQGNKVTSQVETPSPPTQREYPVKSRWAQKQTTVVRILSLWSTHRHRHVHPPSLWPLMSISWRRLCLGCLA